MREIEIVGGGLAGLSLGIALRKSGVPVLIREAGSYPRHRVCGEFINGVTMGTLRHLGIDHLFEDALRHQKTTWWMEGDRILDAELERPALGISRWEMDERLRKSFEELGGILKTGERVAPENREGLVWAAGRVLQKGSSWLGLKAHFTGIDLKGLEMHLGEGGYLGLTPIHGGRVNVCGLFLKRKLGGAEVLDSYLRACGMEQLADCLTEGQMDRASLTGVSGLELGKQLDSRGQCSLGDAERMIPPFTGNGMSMAFESAECALEELVDYAAGRTNWEKACENIRRKLDKRFQKRVNLALALHHFLMKKGGRKSLSWAARTKVLPFHWLHRQLT